MYQFIWNIFVKKMQKTPLLNFLHDILVIFKQNISFYRVFVHSKCIKLIKYSSF